MCKKRTELFIKMAKKQKVENVGDVKNLFVEGLQAVAEDSFDTHKELTDKLSDLEKKFENQSKRIDERLTIIDNSIQQVVEHIIKPKGKILAFLGSKKFLVGVIVVLLITMLSGIGVMGLLDKSANISEIVRSTKGGN